MIASLLQNAGVGRIEAYEYCPEVIQSSSRGDEIFQRPPNLARIDAHFVRNGFAKVKPNRKKTQFNFMAIFQNRHAFRVGRVHQRQTKSQFIAAFWGLTCVSCGKGSPRTNHITMLCYGIYRLDMCRCFHLHLCTCTVTNL